MERGSLVKAYPPFRGNVESPKGEGENGLAQREDGANGLMKYHAKLFPTVTVSFLGILLLACGLVPRPEQTAQPAATVPPTVSTQLPDTALPATPTAGPLLPTETLVPPPEPDFPQVSRGGPNGDNEKNFRSLLDFTPSYFLRMYVFYSENPNEKFKASKDGHGIQSVEFTVTSPDGGKQYYDHTERTPGYCFFGGGEPDCNPWTLENGQFVWKSGGAAVRSGNYGLTVTVTADNGDVGTWLWNKQEGNPIVINVP